MGLAGYYRRFIPDFAKIAKPFNLLLQKGQVFAWTSTQEEAINQLISILCSETLLQFPNFKEPFVVTTDASDYALGAVLSQGPITTTEKELLAIIYAVKQFRPYLYGTQYTLVNDHKPLLWLPKLKDPSARVTRWKILLREYEYEIVHKAGKINMNADALSRNPVSTQPEIVPPHLDPKAMFPETNIEKVFLLTSAKFRELPKGTRILNQLTP